MKSKGKTIMIILLIVLLVCNLAVVAVLRFSETGREASEPETTQAAGETTVDPSAWWPTEETTHQTTAAGNPYIKDGMIEPDLTGRAALLINVDTWKIQYAVNEETRYAQASITKVMTAIIVTELDPDYSGSAYISAKAQNTESNKFDLIEGDQIAVLDLMYGLLLLSSNGCGVALGEHFSGTEEAFVELMNAKAVELGCLNTHFDNTHGIDSATHYSSAMDIAVIMKYAMQYDSLMDIMETTDYSFETENYEIPVWAWNKNEMIGTVEGHICGKGGFDTNAMYCLVSLYENKKGKQYIAVVMGCPTVDWRDWDTYELYAFADRYGR